MFSTKCSLSVWRTGNLTRKFFDPSRLLSPIPEITEAVYKMINEFGKDRYIVNLGHGILPNIPNDHAEVFVDAKMYY